MKFKPAPPENIVLLDRIVGAVPGTERRTMFGYAAYFAGGKFAVGLFADGACMKLAKADRAKALKLRGVSEFAPMDGRVMKDYVYFTKAALKDEARLAAWAKKSVAFVISQPPEKPAKAKTKAAKET